MYFNEYAKTWDTERRIKRAEIIAKEIEKNLDNNINLSAMEFGCGTGLISFHLLHKFKKINLVDSSKEMIKMLEHKIEAFNVRHMNPFLLDLSEDNKNMEKVDVIYSSMVLHHIKDIYDITNKLHHTLNDNGLLIIVDLNKEDGEFHMDEPLFDGHNGFNQLELKSMFENGGFKDSKSYTFYHGEKIIEDKKIKYSLFIMIAKKSGG